MAIPLVVTESVFASASASSTVLLTTLNTNFAKAVSMVYEVILTGFTGTLDFQATTPPNGTQRNIAWVELDREDSEDLSPTNDQLTFAGLTKTRRYLVPISGVSPRVVMTAAAGTITVNAAGYGVYIPPNVSTNATTDVILNLTVNQLLTLNSALEAILYELKKHTYGLTDIVGHDLVVLED